MTDTALTRAGYATGFYEYDEASEAGKPLHTYTVQAYDLRLSDPGRREVTHSVQATSAEHAIHIVSKRRQFPFTRRVQDHPEEACRDNAHYQVDPRFGLQGYIAEREGCSGAIKAFSDAKAEEANRYIRESDRQMRVKMKRITPAQAEAERQAEAAAS